MIEETTTDATPRMPEKFANKYAHRRLGKAKQYSEVHTPYAGPEEAARVAMTARATAEERHLYAQKLFQQRGAQVRNKTIPKLLQIMERRHETHEMLSMVGYDNLRHLIADGLTVAEISSDLNMNQLDLMSFMAIHPEAKKHAQLDALACADSKIRDFLRDLEDNPPATKFDADRRQVQYRVLLEQVKRISSEWANYAEKDKEKAAGSNYHLNVSLNVQQNLPHHEYQNVKVIEHDEALAMAEEAGLSSPDDSNAGQDGKGPVKPMISSGSPPSNNTYVAAPSTDQEGYYIDPLSQQNNIPEPSFD